MRNVDLLVLSKNCVMTWANLSHPNPCFIRSFRGYFTPNLKLACSVCYLKIINTFLKNLKNGIEILVGQAVLSYEKKKTVKNTVLINNSRTTWPTYILMLFLSSLDNLQHKTYIIFSKNVLIILRRKIIEHKTC